ncbi:MAG: hypothetical protein ABIN89_14490 [Chitinophagaceae bacterium]
MSFKTIKNFIASSAELKADRDEFRIFISIENDRLNKQGIYLEIVQWENFLDAISDTRLQDEYNKAIHECDIALCLFFTKVGKYTAEEFHTAYEVFKVTGRPRIWTYFKDAPVNTGSISEEIMTLFSFKKKISELGHFYTGYTNIDNLKYQFKTQLDNMLPGMTRHENAPFLATGEHTTCTPDNEPKRNAFNEILTCRLIEAIQDYSPRARKFLENATRMEPHWETQTRFSDPAKEIIAFSFVGVLGIQLRKLMAIGKEDMSEYKQRKYLENCQLTSKRALQLLCFALLSKLWDYKKEKNFTISPCQTSICRNFFDDEFELDIMGFINLLMTLTAIFTDNNLDFPITELHELQPNLQKDSDFLVACTSLHAISVLLDSSTFTLGECIEAESQLASVLQTLKFLAKYKMVSIKSIGYSEMRNCKPHYLYNYTALGIDSKSNINQERVNYAEFPINTDAVLLYKGSYQQNVNLFPFIIDINALSFESGAKICFYASHDNANGSLNYNFLEDNSVVNILNTETLKPGIDINDVLLDPKKRKDMKFDTVFDLFQEAKRAVTGIDDVTGTTDEADCENPF